MSRKPNYWMLCHTRKGKKTPLGDVGDTKAVSDMIECAQEIGITPLWFPPFNKDSLSQEELHHLIDGIIASVGIGDVMFILSPMIFYAGTKFQKRFYAKMAVRKVSVVVIVVDSANIAYPWYADYKDPDMIPISEKLAWQEAAAMIVHSEQMKEKIRSYGIHKKSFILEVLPYKSHVAPPQKDENFRQLIFAANVTEKRYEFIENIDLGSLPIHVYGQPSQQSKNHLIAHERNFAEELIREMCHGFGLVWDQWIDFSDDREKQYGDWQREYAKYTASSKLSLYLRSGLPVVLWRQDAQADLVLEHGLGFVVDELEEIPARLAEITREEYEKYCRREEKYSRLIEEGIDFKYAVLSAIKYVQGL